MESILLRFTLHFDLENSEEDIIVDIPCNENVYNIVNGSFQVQLIINDINQEEPTLTELNTLSVRNNSYQELTYTNLDTLTNQNNNNQEPTSTTDFDTLTDQININLQGEPTYFDIDTFFDEFNNRSL